MLKGPPNTPKAPKTPKAPSRPEDNPLELHPPGSEVDEGKLESGCLEAVEGLSDVIGDEGSSSLDLDDDPFGDD